MTDEDLIVFGKNYVKQRGTVAGTVQEHYGALLVHMILVALTRNQETNVYKHDSPNKHYTNIQ